MSGLSPRARGNPHGVAVAPGSVGSIPACAGEPRSRAPPQAPPTVYPRVRGGTGLSGISNCICMGLSPRARGNLCQAS